MAQRRVLVGAMVILVTCKFVYAENWSPNPAEIEKVEKELVLPNGSWPIDAYTRYYFYKLSGKRRILGAVFLYGGEAGGIKIVHEADAPHILDGGCSIVNLEYDTDEQKTISISCNGEA